MLQSFTAARALVVAGLLSLCACGTQSSPTAEPTATDTPIVAIDVLLEPDAAMVQTAQRVNAKLTAAYPDGYSLDESHAPHITLLQRYVRESDLEAIYAKLSKVLSPERMGAMRLSSPGTFAAPWGKDQVLVLLVDHTPELDRLHTEVASVLQPYAVSGGDASAFALDSSGEMDADTIGYVETFVPKSSGKAYQPHITVGVAPEPVMTAVKAEPFQPQDFRLKDAAVFQLGRFGTAQKRLWTSPGE